ncbi:hypothetical protein XENTR_v10022551, partial [Xenopus tropicalis]
IPSACLSSHRPSSQRVAPSAAIPSVCLSSHRPSCQRVFSRAIAALPGYSRMSCKEERCRGRAHTEGLVAISPFFKTVSIP